MKNHDCNNCNHTKDCELKPLLDLVRAAKDHGHPPSVIDEIMSTRNEKNIFTLLSLVLGEFSLKAEAEAFVANAYSSAVRFGMRPMVESMLSSIVETFFKTSMPSLLDAVTVMAQTLKVPVPIRALVLPGSKAVFDAIKKATDIPPEMTDEEKALKEMPHVGSVQ